MFGKLFKLFARFKAATIISAVAIVAIGGFAATRVAWDILAKNPAKVIADAPGGGWPILGSGEPEAQSFLITHGSRSNLGGMVGGRGAAYRARITVAPRFEITPERKLRIILDSKRVTNRVLLRRDPGGLALVSWSIDLSDIGNPVSAIKRARAIFDTGTIASLPDSSLPYEIDVPAGASRLLRFEIDFEWLENKKTVTFTAQSTQLSKIKFTPLDPDLELSGVLPLQVFRLTTETDGKSKAVEGTTLKAQLKNGRTGTTTEVNLYLDDERPELFSSSPLLASIEGADPNPGFTEIPACPGDSIEASVYGMTSSLAVFEPSDDFQSVPCSTSWLPAFSLNVVSQASMVFDPGRKSNAEPLRVRLTDERGQGVGGEPIVWQLKEHGLSYRSLTDDDGIAEIDFTPAGRFGSFRAVVDHVATSDPIPEGHCSVEAVPETLLVGSLLTSGPAQFDVDLVRPTVLEAQDRDGHKLNSLLDGESFFVLVRFGRDDASKNKSAQSVEIKLSASGGDSGTLEASRTATPGFYLTRVPHTIKVSKAPVSTYEINGAGTMEASFGGGSLALPVYVNALHRADMESRAILDYLKRVLEAARQAEGLTPEDQSLLDIETKLIANAQAWLREDHPTGKHRVAVSQAYIGLIASLDKNPDGLGALTQRPAKDAALPTSLRNTSIVFISTEEERRVVQALKSATSLSIDAMRNIPASISSNAKEFVNSIPDSIISGPYTLATGRTIEGDEASTLGTVLGGLETVVTIASVVGPAAKLASFGQAVRGIGLRAALGETLASPLEIAEALKGSPAGSLVPEVSEALAAEAAETAKVVSKPAAGAKSAGRLERLLKSAEREKQLLQKWETKGMSAQAKLKQLEEQLARLEERKAKAISAGRGTKTVEKEIGGKKRHIDQVKAQASKLNEKASMRRERLAQVEAVLAQIEKADLPVEYVSKLAREGGLPRAGDRLAGLRAWEQYQQQVAEKLEFEGYVSSTKGVKLTAAYPSPLGEGFGATAEQGLRKETLRPVMDHVHPVTKNVADSKYYDFNKIMSSPDGALKAAREIADTVEKGRLVQMELVAEELGFPPGALEEQAVRDKVWQEVCKKSVTIYTPPCPTPPCAFGGAIPENVEAIIRTLVGPRSAEQVLFKVEKPDILGWLKKAENQRAQVAGSKAH